MTILLEEQSIKNSISSLDKILNNPNETTNPIIDSIDKKSSKNNLAKKVVLLLYDYINPTINQLMAMKKTTIFDNKLYELFDKKTNFHVYQYESYLPNAFTIPGNLLHEYPRLAILSTTHHITGLLILLKYFFQNITKYNDIKPNLKTKPIDLQANDLSIFFSNALVYRAHMNDDEIFSVILHEIGHNVTRKTHINQRLIWLISILLRSDIIAKLSKYNVKTHPMDMLYSPIQNSAIILQQEIFILLLLFFSVILIVNFFKRKNEYKSDEFAGRINPEATKNALRKLHITYSAGSINDTPLEKKFNFIFQQMYRLTDILKNFGLFSYPSNRQRIQNIDKIKNETHMFIKESFITHVYDRVLNKLIDSITTLIQLDQQR